ncbi:uncharacterized protein PWA37_001781 [Arxiozyma heterogenica]|uniref:uncharacterized protein n=1 Tax=Arxiozyma heterogenica TaxID=278026 RepID=UPI002F0FB081
MLKRLLFPLTFLPVQRVQPTYKFVYIILIFASIYFIIGTEIVFISVFAIDSEIQTKLGSPNIWIFGLLNASLFLGSNISGIIFYNLNKNISRVDLFQFAILFWILITIVQLINPFNFVLSMVTRTLKGFLIFAIQLVVPMYIAEVFPFDIFNKFITILEIFQTLGILMHFLGGCYICNHNHKTRNTDLLIMIYLLLALITYCFSIFIPESPFWLILKGNYDKAEENQKKFAQLYDKLDIYPSKNKVDLVDFYLNNSIVEDKDSIKMKKIILLFSILMKVSCGMFILYCYTIYFTIIIDEHDSSTGAVLLMLTLIGFILSYKLFENLEITIELQYKIFLAFILLFSVINIVDSILLKFAFQSRIVREDLIMSFFCLLFVECVCYSLAVCTLPNILCIKIAYDSRNSQIPFIYTQIQYFVIAMYLICMIRLISDQKLSWIFFMFMGNINIFFMIILCLVMNIYKKETNNSSNISSTSEDRTENNKQKGMDPIILTGFV